jgi:dolichol-phosphate mannosyltransferase
MKTVIIIPTYNESAVIESVIDALQLHIQNIPDQDIQILIYDSHSPDGTAALIEAYQKKYNNIHLASEAEKSGLGSAYIKAMQYAMDTMKADIVFEYDADGSHQPQFIPHMIKQLEAGYDVVVGSRYVPGGSIPSDWGVHRKILSVLGNYIARFFLTWRYKDFTSGFRATRTSFLKQIPLKELLSKQYAYKIHLLWALHKLGARIREYPIAFIDRKQGISKFPRNNITDSLRVVFTLRYREMIHFIRKLF